MRNSPLKYGVSVSEIKKEMQGTINVAYVFPTSDALKVPHQNTVPTIDELFAYAVKQLTSDEKESRKEN